MPDPWITGRVLADLQRRLNEPAAQLSRRDQARKLAAEAARLAEQLGGRASHAAAQPPPSVRLHFSESEFNRRMRRRSA